MNSASGENSSGNKLSKHEQRTGFMWRYYYTMKDNRYQLYSAALEYFGKYDSKLDPRLKLEFSLLFLTIGFLGFSVSKEYIKGKFQIGMHVWSYKYSFHGPLRHRLLPDDALNLPEA